MKKLAAPIPRFALTKPEAAAAIGVGPDFFAEHVLPHLSLVRIGSKTLVPAADIERWVSEHAEAPIALQAGQSTRGAGSNV
jgi:hypothetical protein